MFLEEGEDQKIAATENVLNVLMTQIAQPSMK